MNRDLHSDEVSGHADQHAHDIDAFLVERLQHAPTSWKALGVLLVAALITALSSVR